MGWLFEFLGFVGFWLFVAWTIGVVCIDPRIRLVAHDGKRTLHEFAVVDYRRALTPFWFRRSLHRRGGHGWTDEATGKQLHHGTADALDAQIAAQDGRDWMLAELEKEVRRS